MTTMVPIETPGVGFRTHDESEVYNGKIEDYENGAKYVPNVGDAILTPSGWSRVTSVNTARLSTTTPITLTDDSELVEEELGQLIGSPIQKSGYEYFCYLDTDKFPYRLGIDSRYHDFSPLSEYIRIFKGTDISTTTGQVISAQYDHTGTFTSDTIRLESVYDANSAPTSIKSPMEGFSNVKLNSGEKVTVVVFGNHGRVMRIDVMSIIETNLIRPASQGQRYVSAIRLVSPYIDQTDISTIRIPQFLNRAALNLQAEITYSTEKELRNIDGTSVSLVGFDSLACTVVGDSETIHLRYKLAANENNLTDITPNGEYILRRYKVRIIEEEKLLALKLFTFPRWDGLDYSLEHYLLNLERDVFYRVTPYVSLVGSGPAFNPTRYGVEQELTFSVNMKDVNPVYPDYNHTQTIHLALMAAGNTPIETKWRVKFGELDSNTYGQNVAAAVSYVNSTTYAYDISCGKSDLQSWLDKVYYPLEPLYSSIENEPLVPTHVKVSYSGQEFELPLSNWNLGWTDNLQLTEGSLITLVFVKKLVDGDRYLAVGGMSVTVI